MKITKPATHWLYYQSLLSKEDGAPVSWAVLKQRRVLSEYIDKHLKPVYDESLASLCWEYFTSAQVTIELIASEYDVITECVQKEAVLCDLQWK